MRGVEPHTAATPLPVTHLRELRLSVCATVFVTVAARELKVPVHATYHEELRAAHVQQHGFYTAASHHAATPPTCLYCCGLCTSE
jgi:hypothetical protein